MKNTLYDKIWSDHCIHENEDKSSLIYIDRHLIHEVTSPQAFDGLKLPLVIPPLRAAAPSPNLFFSKTTTL